MKKILIITILSILLYSEINYRMALEAVSNSDMTDSSISDIMSLYGFNNSIFEEITFIHKLKAVLCGT